MLFAEQWSICDTKARFFIPFIRQIDTEESERSQAPKCSFHAEIKAVIIWGSLTVGSISPQHPYLACTHFLRYCCYNGVMEEVVSEAGFYLQPSSSAKGPASGCQLCYSHHRAPEERAKGWSVPRALKPLCFWVRSSPLEVSRA